MGMTLFGKPETTRMKTKNKAHDLAQYLFSAGERVMIDANVWLYLFPPTVNPCLPAAIRNYSGVFARLLKVKAQPILDPLILSEYVNRYCRMEWEGGYKTRYAAYKDFRNSPDFCSVATSATSFAVKIVNACQTHATPANSLDLRQTLTDFSSGQIDFNDSLLADICLRQHYKLLTNDSDFQFGGIDVLTLNRKLLQACR